MTKVVLNNVTSGFNVSTINSNFDKIETELNDKVLYRNPPDGEPNAMETDLDMNGRRIYNLPLPINENEPVRLKDISGLGGIVPVQAIDVEFEPNVNIASVNVQNAIEETYAELKQAIEDLELGGGVLPPFTQSGTGAVERTSTDKMRDFRTIKDFDIDTTGGLDSTVGLQAAIDSGFSLDFIDKNVSIKISDTIEVPSGMKLSGKGATITQTATQKPIFDVRNTTGVTIEGFKMYGKAESPFVNTPASLAIGIRGDYAVDLTVQNNEFYGFCYAPLMVALWGTNIRFMYNKVVGPGVAVLSNPNYRNCTGVTILGYGVYIIGNTISETSQGLIVGQQSRDIIVAYNQITNTRVEHGMYIDSGCKRVIVADNNVSNTVLNGMKIQYYDDIVDVPYNMKFVGNTVDTAGGDGIVILNAGLTTIATITAITQANPGVITTALAHGLSVNDVVSISGVVGMTPISIIAKVNSVPTATSFSLKVNEVPLDTTSYPAYVSGGLVTKPRFGNNFLIADNTVNNITQDGIGIRFANDGVVGGNVVKTCGRYGIYCLAVGGVDINNNIVKDVQKNGVYVFTPIEQCSISDNTLANCGAAGDDTAGGSSGVYIEGNGGVNIEFNTITGESTQTKMQYGIYLTGGDKRRYSVRGNTVTLSQDAGFRAHADDNYSLKYLGENVFESALSNNAIVGLPSTSPGRGTPFPPYYHTAAPVTGTWNQGDKVWNTYPPAGGNVGWVCEVAGTPGTWIPFGPVRSANAYSTTNVVTDRALNATADTLAQVAHVLGTLIQDLQASGVLRT